jgi:hypothetical protein
MHYQNIATTLVALAATMNLVAGHQLEQKEAVNT